MLIVFVDSVNIYAYIYTIGRTLFVEESVRNKAARLPESILVNPF